MPIATATLQMKLADILRRLKRRHEYYSLQEAIKRKELSEARFMNGEPLFNRDETRQIMAEFLRGRPMDEQSIQALLVRLNREIRLAEFSKGLTVGYIYSSDHHGMIFVLVRIAGAEQGD